MAEKICGIYKITNTVNGKVYIGQSIDIAVRWKHHRTLGKGEFVQNTRSKYPLYQAMRKYGIDNFVFEIIEEVNEEYLNEQEEFYIRLYKSDNPKYGYNCSKRFASRRLTSSELHEIEKLLYQSSLTFCEIAELYNVSSTTIGYINDGKVYYRSDRQYPFRPQKNSDIVQYISYIKHIYNIPDIKYRRYHSPQETVEYINNELDRLSSTRRRIALKYCSNCGKKLNSGVKGTMCKSCLDQYKAMTNRLPESEINFSLIERILDSSMRQVAYEYGYSDGNSVSHLLKAHNLPATRTAMFEYYEQQTGHKHWKIQQKEKRKEEARRHNEKCTPQPVAQYDENRNLVAVYPSMSEAARSTGIHCGHISECCSDAKSRKTAGGFFWEHIVE